MVTRTTSKVTVAFNAVEEYIAELERDAGKIDRNIVRCTKLFEPSKMSPNIRFISAFSAYVVDGQVITFTRYCGDTWRINQEEDDKVIAKADGYIKSITEACERLGLEVRAGMIKSAISSSS